ncbi:MAG TPA: RNase P subunit [Nitrososphaera sp.]|nr:RNase P subunit [Nitrososphaera sp.]
MSNKARAKEIARERINILIKTALLEKDPDLAALQARLAKKIAMRYRVRLPYDVRQLFCKKCKAFIVPGKSGRVRVGRARIRAIRVTCLKCGHTYRKVISAE